MSAIDMQRAQIMRQRCNRVFAGKNVHDIVGALQMLTADLLTDGLGLSGDQAIGAARAIAVDIENIVREREADRGRAN